MNSDAVIVGRSVAIGYSDKHPSPLYTDMNFTLYRGEFTALLGVNGAGKSTLLRTLAGMQPCLGGEIRLHDRALSTYGNRDIARHIATVLTERNVAGGLLVEELVAMGRYPYTGFFGRLSGDDRAVIDRVMRLVGIAHKRDSYLSQLSDGERQKAFIAKALAQESDVILLDEPTAFLDLPSRIEMFVLLGEIATHEGKAILLTTHDIEQALTLCDRLWLLSAERGLQCGTTDELIARGDVETMFCNDHITFDTTHRRFLPRNFNK